MATPKHPVRAILRWHKDGVGVLCPIGHVLTWVPTAAQSDYAGSVRVCELTAHQRGRPNIYDRMAEACCASHVAPPPPAQVELPL